MSATGGVQQEEHPEPSAPAAAGEAPVTTAPLQEGAEPAVDLPSSSAAPPENKSPSPDLLGQEKTGEEEREKVLNLACVFIFVLCT